MWPYCQNRWLTVLYLELPYLKAYPSLCSVPTATNRSSKVSCPFPVLQGPLSHQIVICWQMSVGISLSTTGVGTQSDSFCCLNAIEEASGVFVGRREEKVEKQQVRPGLCQRLARALPFSACSEAVTVSLPPPWRRDIWSPALLPQHLGLIRGAHQQRGSRVCRESRVPAWFPPEGQKTGGSGAAESTSQVSKRIRQKKCEAQWLRWSQWMDTGDESSKDKTAGYGMEFKVH